MKYIRTKDGIFEYHLIDKEHLDFLVDGNVIETHETIDEYEIADTIEELIQDNDILYIHDLYPDAVLVVEGKIKPFGYQNAIELKKWLKHKTKFDLYIRDSKGNYIYVAKMNEDDKLCLLG